MRPKRKRLNWKTRWFLSIFGAVLLVIFLLFGGTYYYFVQKLTATNEQIVNMRFQETEGNLRVMIANAEYYLMKFANDNLIWKFYHDVFPSKSENSVTIQKIVWNFDQRMYADNNLYAFAVVNGDGKSVVSTVEKKSRTGKIETSSHVAAAMKKSKEVYPYVAWITGAELELPEDSPLYCLVNRPVLLGIRSLGEAEEPEEDGYLIVALDEEAVQKSYKTVSYNGSRAALVDSSGKIISCTDKQLLETQYSPDRQDQNIEYPISYHQWKLVDMIPKDEYLREAHDIRNVGLISGVLAMFGVLGFCLIWNRKYTRPIQILMDQMEMVGKEQLDIGKPAQVGWPELDHLNEQFYFTVQKLKGYILRLQTAEKEKAGEELRALQYQINPHFLYNSLNSIRWMAMMTNNTKVADSLVTLCKIIMPIFRNPSFTWKLRDELEFLDNYVKMMRIRYGSGMEFNLECPEDIKDITFPRFILQPIIENCFVHGSSQDEIRHIYLRLRKTERFAIEVQNTGVFLDKEKIDEINKKINQNEGEEQGIGLSNIRKRLVLLYGDTTEIWLESIPERGLLVYICF